MPITAASPVITVLTMYMPAANSRAGDADDHALGVDAHHVDGVHDQPLAVGRAARAGMRVYIQRARDAGMSWAQVGEALGVAELARQRGSSLAGAAWQYAAEWSAYLTGEFGVFRWTCRSCGEVISDRGPSGRYPAEGEPGHAEGCQRLAAAVAEWLAQDD